MARLTINGEIRDIEVAPETPLLWALREQAGLTGTKFGCGIAQCGACTVLIDGVATRSCALPASAVGPDQQILTVEGLSNDATHPIQQAWLALDVPQCGYCQAGMIMA
ncbi:(2Fe-2S)-binding protein, partial [Sinorhizobium medicae]